MTAPKTTHVYLDMDGVLADFPGVWDMHIELGYPTDDDFWNDIRDYPEFWETMKPYSYLRRFINFIATACQEAGAKYSVASNPDKNPVGYSGKRAWYDQYLEH